MRLSASAASTGSEEEDADHARAPGAANAQPTTAGTRFIAQPAPAGARQHPAALLEQRVDRASSARQRLRRASAAARRRARSRAHLRWRSAPTPAPAAAAARARAGRGTPRRSASFASAGARHGAAARRQVAGELVEAQLHRPARDRNSIKLPGRAPCAASAEHDEARAAGHRGARRRPGPAAARSSSRPAARAAGGCVNSPMFHGPLMYMANMAARELVVEVRDLGVAHRRREAVVGTAPT